MTARTHITKGSRHHGCVSGAVGDPSRVVLGAKDFVFKSNIHSWNECPDIPRVVHAFRLKLRLRSFANVF